MSNTHDVPSIAGDKMFNIDKALAQRGLFCGSLAFASFILSLTIEDGLGGYAFYVGWYFVAWGFVALWRRFSNVPENFGEIVLLSYHIISFLGLLVVFIYQVQYGVPFSPYWDDSYYFENAFDYAFAKVDYARTLRLSPFEYLLAFMMDGMNFLGIDEPQLVYLLPMNWCLGALSVGLAAQLAYLLQQGREVRTSIVLLLVLGESVLTLTVLHLYRDALVVFSFLIAAVAIMERRYLLWIAGAYVCFRTRGLNAFFLLLFSGLTFPNWASIGGPQFKHLRLALKIAIPGLIGAALLIAYIRFAADLIEYISPLYAGTRYFNIDDMLARRREILFDPRVPAPLWPLFYLFQNVIPNRIHLVADVQAGGHYLENTEILDPQLLFWLLSGPAMVFLIIPMFLVSSWRIIKSSDMRDYVVLVFFAVTTSILGLVSMQPRHKLAVTVLYPFLYLIFSADQMSRGERVVFRATQIGLALFWLFAFVYKYLFKAPTGLS